MLTLTTLGMLHTAVSLVAVGAGLYALVLDRQILPDTRQGRIYVIATVITCLTSLGIFQHGGFGPPHVLAILTLVVLIVGVAAGKRRFGRASRYVQAIAFSTSFFFHWIPGVIETTTRFPTHAPIFSSQEAPGLQVVLGIVFIVFLAGTTLQIRWLRRQQSQDPFGSLTRVAAPQRRPLA